MRGVQPSHRRLELSAGRRRRRRRQRQRVFKALGENTRGPAGRPFKDEEEGEIKTLDKPNLRPGVQGPCFHSGVTSPQ